jgi:hypothetical protein
VPLRSSSAILCLPTHDFLSSVGISPSIGGGVEAGPNAVLAFKREDYAKALFSIGDVWKYARCAGICTHEDLEVKSRRPRLSISQIESGPISGVGSARQILSRYRETLCLEPTGTKGLP